MKKKRRKRNKGVNRRGEEENVDRKGKNNKGKKIEQNNKEEMNTVKIGSTKRRKRGKTNKRKIFRGEKR